MTSLRLVGAGRAARSFAAAFEDVGVEVRELLPRGAALGRAAFGVDALVLCVPDDAVEEVARATDPVPGTAVLHVSGSLGLDVLAPHPRRGSLHPLVPLPDAEVGARRLLGGATFAVAGDPTAAELVELLGGRLLRVADGDRAAYHAAATVAANHLVALLGQVERVARLADLPLAGFTGLARAALEDVERLGPEAALTGPARRGDERTLEAHRAVLSRLGRTDETAYEAGVALARLLAERVERVERVDGGVSAVAS